MERSLFVGIDVAKDHLDVHAVPTDATFRVAHDAAGLATLCERLVAWAPTLIVLEATGGHEVPVVAALASAGLPVVIVNPLALRTRAARRVVKTDEGNAWRFHLSCYQVWLGRRSELGALWGVRLKSGGAGCVARMVPACRTTRRPSSSSRSSTRQRA